MNTTSVIVKDVDQIDNLVWKNKKILVAEDIELNFLYITELIKPTKAKILRALNGKEALDLCLQDLTIDLVLMDIYMPYMNGYEATRQIKAIRKDLPIIAQTAYNTVEDRSKALEAGCDDFIAKPIEKEELLIKMDRLFKVKGQ